MMIGMGMPIAQRRMPRMEASPGFVAKATRLPPCRFPARRVRDRAKALLLAGGLVLPLACCADPGAPASLHAHLGGDLDVQQATVHGR